MKYKMGDTVWEIRWDDRTQGNDYDDKPWRLNRNGELYGRFEYRPSAEAALLRQYECAYQ